MAIITTSEAARRKGVTRAAIARAVAEGRLRARRSGTGRTQTWLIEEEDLERYQPLHELRDRQARGVEARRR